MTIIQVKVISGYQVKKVKQKIGIQTCDTCFRSGFRKNAKNEPQTLFEASISVKNKIRKITVKSRNDVKVSIFDMFCVISQLFSKLST